MLSWFGRLPGDIRIESERSRTFIPITSMIILSVVLGSVDVSSRAALLRQRSPGRAAFRKARDAGNGIPLSSPATPLGDI
ncbi:DUF2905 domain-containing protein, partial [Pseudomonas stutzeri]